MSAICRIHRGATVCRNFAPVPATARAVDARNSSGVQGHLHGDSFDPAALQKALDVLTQFKLPIRITEFNFPGQRSKYYTGDRRAVMTPEEEQAKAEALH